MIGCWEVLRKGAWHFRKGGPSELAEFVRRARRPGYAVGAGRPKTLVDGDAHHRSFQPWDWPDLPPRRSTRVGIIADPFTLAAFKYEWDQVELRQSDWASQLDDLDLVFVESAWAGNGKDWQYQVTGPNAPSSSLVELLSTCRDRGIPTVFWNKEDPTHFEEFLYAARLCDWVFTTDSECVDRYREALGHSRVAAMPFAVQERVCNPVRVTSGHQPLGTAFAGTWFAHKYPERREQMRLLFDAALKVESDENRFEIFSRFQGIDEKYEFPEPYSSHVVGSLDYDRMLSAYRSYKVFLNVNTVTTSPTMCARRVLEITACGTPVVSTPAPSLSPFLGNGIVQVDDPAAAMKAIGLLVGDEDARARLVHEGQRRLWQRHTYGHRVDDVLGCVAIGNPAPVSLPSVSVLASTIRPQQLDHLLEQVACQRDVDVELLVATHGFEDVTLAQRARQLGLDNVGAVPMPATASLGECLNTLAAHASGAVFSKMDDDDFYGEHYLEDLLWALRFSGAQVVGKQCRFVRLESRRVTVLTEAVNEHRYTNFVAGPTLTWQADLGIGFSEITHGEDSDFLQQVLKADGSIYASDRFNFLQMRSGDPAHHTWTVEDEGFLDKGEVVDGVAWTV